MTWYWHPAHLDTELSLQNYAWNISTMSGRMRMAGRRGDNVTVPFREGTVWVPKVYDETELELFMWVVGSDEDGEFPQHPSDQFWENYETLKRAFVTDRALGILSYDHPTLGQRVYAEAEIVDEIDPDSEAGATRAAFIVTFVLPKVWFRPATFSGDSALTTRTDGEEWTIDIDSDVPMKDAVIRFRNPGGLLPVSNITLSNRSLSASDHWLTYQGLVAPGDTVTIDVGAWRATLDDGSDVSNNLDWSGQPEFFELIPGENDLHVTFDDLGVDPEVQVQAKGRYW